MDDEIDSRKRIIARYLNGGASLQEGTTTASSVLQLVDQIEYLARLQERTKGYKEGIAHCERRDNNPIFNWYVKEYLKEEFLHLDLDLPLQEPLKVFADKLSLSIANQIFADLKKHEMGYGDIVLSKEELRELKKKYKVD
jgi:hypothetical protein